LSKGTERTCANDSTLEVSGVSNANLVSGMVNLEKPHSKQTKSFGNRQTPGLSTLFKPEKWMIISAENSTW